MAPNGWLGWWYISRIPIGRRWKSLPHPYQRFLHNTYKEGKKKEELAYWLLLRNPQPRWKYYTIFWLQFKELNMERCHGIKHFCLHYQEENLLDTITFGVSSIGYFYTINAVIVLQIHNPPRVKSPMKCVSARSPMISAEMRKDQRRFYLTRKQPSRMRTAFLLTVFHSIPCIRRWWVLIPGVGTYPLSSGSSSRVRGAEKHEIYVAAFGGHLFYDLFLQDWGGHGPLGPPLDPLLPLYEQTHTCENIILPQFCLRKVIIQSWFAAVITKCLLLFSTSDAKNIKNHTSFHLQPWRQSISKICIYLIHHLLPCNVRFQWLLLRFKLNLFHTVPCKDKDMRVKKHKGVQTFSNECLW